MDMLQGLLLGIIQGITEFLPISSSGHLVLAQHFFGIQEENLLFDTVLHAGTALSILVVFWKDISTLALNLFSSDRLLRAQSLRYGTYVVVATIPAGFAGVFLKDFFETRFGDARGAGAMLLVTAALLLFTMVRKQTRLPLSLWAVVIIGCAQAVAIMPGISRSGATIATALLVGVSREEAGRFSFLLALPAILGAMVLQLKDVEALTLPLSTLGLGFVVSFMVGIVSLRVLLGFVKQGRLHYFGAYCVVAGLSALIFIR